VGTKADRREAGTRALHASDAPAKRRPFRTIRWRSRRETLEAFATPTRSGEIRYWGVRNFDIDAARCCAAGGTTTSSADLAAMFSAKLGGVK
jgi:aryl-alcohol dehydrogenase-like predicted oxidoreductase